LGVIVEGTYIKGSDIIFESSHKGSMAKDNNFFTSGSLASIDVFEFL